MSKNFFEKIGLVESKAVEDFIPVITQEACIPAVEIDIETTQPNTLIQDAYTTQAISDISKSVYKVEEFINALPADMPNKTKQISVLGILTVSGMNPNEIITDAENRLRVLSGALNTVIVENKDIIFESNQDIEKLKEAIENANHVISDKENIIKQSEDIIGAEVERINKLKDFVGGMLV